MNEKIKRIGIDIMGVILPKSVEGGTLEEFMACSALPNVVESIKKLVHLYGQRNIFIISRCPEFAEKVIIQWFETHNFFIETNFSRSNIYFCREQADKAPLAKQLTLSYFIDDKINVLDFMDKIVLNRIQLAVESNLTEGISENGIITLTDWPSVINIIAEC